jgi:3'(2'), 5'-bisphosphate nucleotidase
VGDHAAIDPSELLKPAIEVAISAGRRILEIYEGGFNVAHKNDQTPLTEADMAAHAIIDDGFVEQTPDLPVLSEESAHIPFEQRSQWRRYWLVDPLDGTREFIRRSGEFSVNIALVDGHEAVLGVVYAPVLGVYWYACRGHGAFRREATSAPERIHVRARRRDPIVVAGSRAHRGEALERFLKNLGPHECLPMGSAVKSCLVAEGEADLYPRLGPTSEWDTAAAQCIVEEAGGRLTDLSLQPLRYNTKDSLLNPHFFVFGDASADWRRYL